MSNTLQQIQIGNIRGTRTRLTDCAFVQLDPSIRIYHTPRNDEDGFYFFIARLVSSPSAGEVPSGLDHPHARVECIAFGDADRSGIRRLFQGHEDTGNAAFLSRPDLPMMASAYQALATLEQTFCPERRGSCAAAA